MSASRIARLMGIPRATVSDWLHTPLDALVAGPVPFDPRSLPNAEYSYLFGLYLGDGTISRGPKGVYRLRIVNDARYPKITAECVAAMRAVMPRNRVHVQKLPFRAVEIHCYSKGWPLLFPQHGPGRKHERKIELAPWQKEVVDRFPREFLRGLIHSDGCRVLNRVNGKDYPRYFFTQVSDDIRGIFCRTCRLLEIHYSQNNWKTISIARSGSVARLDEFIGPKA
jgi:hypothetical protein